MIFATSAESRLWLPSLACDRIALCDALAHLTLHSLYHAQDGHEEEVSGGCKPHSVAQPHLLIYTDDDARVSHFCRQVMGDALRLAQMGEPVPLMRLPVAGRERLRLMCHIAA